MVESSASPPKAATFGALSVSLIIACYFGPMLKHSAPGHCYLMLDDLKKAYSSYQQALYFMKNPQVSQIFYEAGVAD